MTRSIHALTALSLALALGGCARLGDSALNPLDWFGDDRPDTIAPKGGYEAATLDRRPLIPVLLDAELRNASDGKLLVVRGMGTTPGWFKAALVAPDRGLDNRLQVDENGVLALRFVAIPPYPNDPSIQRAAVPERDAIVVATKIGRQTLARLRSVQITGASQTLTVTP